jgi:hypothetical protein
MGANEIYFYIVPNMKACSSFISSEMSVDDGSGKVEIILHQKFSVFRSSYSSQWNLTA